MKVLYDFQTFYYQNFGGISRCFAELISHLPEEVIAKIGVKESDNVYLKELGLVADLQPLHWTRNNFILPFYFKGQGKLLTFCNRLKFLNTPYNLNKNYTIELLQKGDFDIFHPTYFDDYYLPYLEKKPFVLTIHDMIPELFVKGDNYQSNKKRKLVEKATHIVAVSENTKRDIVDILKVPEEKITVIYHAVNNSFNQKFFDNINYDKLHLPSRYILYVGLRNSYKSFSFYLKQTASFFRENRDIYLLCTGSSFTKKEKELIVELGLEKQLRTIFLSTDELMYVYTKAIAFVYPSRYEGFGIPILEAYAMNCPVLLNNASCFPEIARDAALFFNLDDKESCLDTLKKVCNLTTEERKTLIDKGAERLNDFSWEKSARQLVDVYKKVIG